jgi:hypothetical protein
VKYSIAFLHKPKYSCTGGKKRFEKMKDGMKGEVKKNIKNKQTTL